ncbi:unnamed protein product [Strongylus vulgaris]|uniref:Uncharacterized protein n=1 Tax=Strongylus vulgaris TaxID=40348 RepID=A0A3P7JBW9_STRVU|nr:unnamed protein product [Strongylus vulgaris]
MSSISSHGLDSSELPRFRFANDDSLSNEEEQPAPVRKKAIKNRRSSIPDAFSFQTTAILQEAARKFMRDKSSDRKLAQSRARPPEVTQLLPKKGDQKKVSATKTLHLNVYDLPDVEEKGEDGTFSPPKVKNENEDNCYANPTKQQNNNLTALITANSNPLTVTTETPQDISLWWEVVTHLG